MEHYIRHKCSERTIIAQVLCSLVPRGKGGCIIVIRLFIGIPQNTLLEIRHLSFEWVRFSKFRSPGAQ